MSFGSRSLHAPLNLLDVFSKLNKKARFIRCFGLFLQVKMNLQLYRVDGAYLVDFRSLPTIAPQRTSSISDGRRSATPTEHRSLASRGLSPFRQASREERDSTHNAMEFFSMCAALVTALVVRWPSQPFRTHTTHTRTMPYSYSVMRQHVQLKHTSFKAHNCNNSMCMLILKTKNHVYKISGFYFCT